LNRFLRHYWPVAPALLCYGVLARRLSFIQDDAYISYRYVANYLNGHGLVYNIGERVEGFTNFGWTIYMILWGSFGVDFITVSRLTGLLLGAGVIILTYLIARDLFGAKNNWFAVAATLLVGINQSLANWSQAGLETAAFAFLVMLSLLLYLRRSWMLIFSLLLAVWVRPEGAVVTGLLIMLELVQERKLPRYTLICAATAFLFSLPFVAFKLLYYGSILPNPFFAKTSFTLSQLSDGIEYASRYFGHYGFWGTGLILPLLFFKKLSDQFRQLWLFAVLYIAYIVLIGGDVLKVHRFFLPLFGPMAILLMASIWVLVRNLKQANRYLILTGMTLVLLVFTYILPKQYVERYNQREQGFTEKMQYKAERIKEADSSNFSVAVATIGIFGYELLGHDVIDLLGLTDSTIARYTEKPIPGMETTWKEQKHNSSYLLQRAPDYIMFSTGVKPSAPAERALLLYRQFMDSYRTVGWHFKSKRSKGPGVITIIFKRVRPIEGELEPVYPVEYVQYYKKGLDAFSKRDHRTAVSYYDSALAVSPRPYFIYVLYQKAFSLLALQQNQPAVQLLNSILKRDSLIFEAHSDLYRVARILGDENKASIHEGWLKRLVPWYWPRVKSTTDQMVISNRRRQP